MGPCFGGLGSGTAGIQCASFEAGKYARNWGRLTYTPSSASAEDVINELAALMTAGRLSAASRQSILKVFQSEPVRALAVIKAQSLIAASPEFHSTNIVRRSGKTRPLPTSPKPSTKEYKAVVYVTLSGGVDSFNMPVPHTCRSNNTNGQNLREQYNAERTTVAFTDDERTRIIDASGQPCEQFAIHPSLEIVERLYKEGDLAFFANAGVLNAPVTKKNYNRFHPNHSSLITTPCGVRLRRRIHSEKAPGTGALAPRRDVLAAHWVRTPSPCRWRTRSSRNAVGVPGRAITPLTVSATGAGTFIPKPKNETFDPRGCDDGDQW
jgi:hypothetical protein